MNARKHCGLAVSGVLAQNVRNTVNRNLTLGLESNNRPRIETFYGVDLLISRSCQALTFPFQLLPTSLLQEYVTGDWNAAESLVGG